MAFLEDVGSPLTVALDGETLEFLLAFVEGVVTLLVFALDDVALEVALELLEVTCDSPIMSPAAGRDAGF